MRRLAEHADIGAGAEHVVLARLDDDAADLRMLEAQALHRVVQFDVDAKIVGIELELVVAEPAGLVDVHDQVGDVAVIFDAPVPVARRVGLVINGVGHRRPNLLKSFRDGPKGRTRNPDASAEPGSGFRVRTFGAPRNDGSGAYVHYLAYE